MHRAHILSRAYIAASRRSDRSLEARLESAKRASDIHKRRTGRSLRVTESDVINEEMYEEEDDDLPLQYRRLTAHLNTNSPDFNRRLASYVTGNIAMRQILEDAISKSSQTPQQSYFNTGHNLQHMQNTQQPWMQSNAQSTTSRAYPNPMLPPNMVNQASTYRRSPYPSPLGPGGYHQRIQRRPSSISVPHQSPIVPSGQITPESPGDASQKTEQRRSSASVAEAPEASPPCHDNSKSTTLQEPTFSTSPSASYPSAQAQMRGGSSTSIAPHQQNDHQLKVDESHDTRSLFFPQSQNMPTPPGPQGLYPLSTSVPLETQQFLPSGYDLNPSSLPQSASSEHLMQQPFYSYNPNNTRSRNMHPSFDGMSQTLAPGALDTTLDGYNWTAPQSAIIDSASTTYPPTSQFPAFDTDFGHDTMKMPLDDSSPDSLGTGSGDGMHDEAEWSTFFNESPADQFSEQTAQ